MMALSIQTRIAQPLRQPLSDLQFSITLTNVSICICQQIVNNFFLKIIINNSLYNMYNITKPKFGKSTY